MPTSRSGTCRFDPWANARVSLAGPIAGGIGAAACLVVGEAQRLRLLLALAYAGFLLNLFNLAPSGSSTAATCCARGACSARAAGAPSPAEARRLSWVVAGMSLATAAALVLGMIAAHVPQDRL